MLPKYTISDYLEEVKEQFHSGQAKEHAYRPALKRLMSSFEDTIAVNDPKRSEHGNPDFIFLKASNQKIIRGYAEAKDVDVSLDKIEKTNQMERYHGYSNLFLTDYLEFRFFKNGDKYKTITLGNVAKGELILTPENEDELARELKAFLELPPEKIKSGRRLAEIMGGKARRIRDNVKHYLKFNDEKSQELEKIYQMMRELLVHDLSEEKFADMYAQTLVYGLFVARYGDNSPDDFSRIEARDLVPASNPFLRQFFDHIVGPDFDVRLGYIVDELCEVFSVSDVQQIVHQHLRISDDREDGKDPIIHFYEDFLNEYDPSERKKMGAYYTPTPVVRFIVREVDRILKEDFSIVKGIASDETYEKEVEVGQDLRHDRRTKKVTTQKIQFSRVQVLDPALGTATFLNETIKYIRTGFDGQEGQWPAYVKNNLIKRLHGFELMMAPYTIAHLKLGMTLRESGVSDLSQRLSVYLTNSLEEGIPNQGDLFSFGLARAVSDESRYAAKIKTEQPVMVVMGNPPYSVSSNNKSNWIEGLLKVYKKDLDEQNIQPLSDDYIKFIRFSEELISKNGQGIVAMITNNSYMDGVIHRQMRKHLSKTFDKIYILDLHGNSKKKETTPDGEKDENVFDIMQGVGIILAVKTPVTGGVNLNETDSKLADIYHAEIFGTRKHKFTELEKSIDWEKLKIDEKATYFVPKNTAGQSEYERGIKLDDLFIQKSSGLQTKRDKLFIDFDKQTLNHRIEHLLSADLDEKFTKEFKVENSSSYKMLQAINRSKFDSSHTVPIMYRPFDVRYIYYDKNLLGRAFDKTMQHMLKDNIAILTSRMTKDAKVTHFCVTETVSEMKTAESSTQSFHFPLWIYYADGTKSANFDDKVFTLFTNNLKEKCNPEDVFDYIYAVLNSPNYREKYKVFLKTDYPRIPIPKDSIQFASIKRLGEELKTLHLMKAPYLNDYITTYPHAGNNEVETVRYVEGKVWINETQYFGSVPEVAWNFYIGGYQPAQKWLKDRKGRTLTNTEIDHYQKIIKVLVETDKLMLEIDKHITF